MTWYQGRAIVAAAVIGAALLVRELLRGRMVFTLGGDGERALRMVRLWRW